MSPTVEHIHIPDDKLEWLNTILNAKTISNQSKNNAKKQVYGGFCMGCPEYPSKIVTFQLDGIKLVEKFCDRCYERNKKRIHGNKR